MEGGEDGWSGVEKGSGLVNNTGSGWRVKWRVMECFVRRKYNPTRLMGEETSETGYCCQPASQRWTSIHLYIYIYRYIYVCMCVCTPSILFFFLFTLYLLCEWCLSRPRNFNGRNLILTVHLTNIQLLNLDLPE